MSTLWWVVVLSLACGLAFAVGFIVRGEFELYARATRETPEPIDFTRHKVGA